MRRALVLLAVARGGARRRRRAGAGRRRRAGHGGRGPAAHQPALAAAAVSAWSQLGVDVVRIHARWWEIAPAGGATKAPSGFNAADPDDPRYHWGTLDIAVALVRAPGCA